MRNVDRTRVRAKVGPVVLGDGSIAIQSMLKKPLASYSIGRLRRLRNMGCDMMRFSILGESENEIRAFTEKCSSVFPIISDIQGNASQAAMSLRAGCAAIRINPANFKADDLAMIADLAGERGAAIRIGINEGSLSDRSDGAITGLLGECVSFFESRAFTNLVLSVKSSDPDRTIRLNRLVSSAYPYPMHVGLTEAGAVEVSAVRSALALARIMDCGRVDTIRYSISGSEESETRCAYEFLRTLGKAPGDFRMVSCPMCARAGCDTERLARKVESLIFGRFDIRRLKLKVAVMGCAVNGPGEARDADVALCAFKSGGAVYRDGRLVGRANDESSLADAFMEAVEDAAERSRLRAGDF